MNNVPANGNGLAQQMWHEVCRNDILFQLLQPRCVVMDSEDDLGLF